MNTTEVENFPGFPGGIQGPELMDGLQQQAEKFGAQVVFDDVTEVTLAGHLKRVVTGAGETHEAPAVILATGSAYKELGLPEEKKFSGHGLSWCATCDGFFFRDQDIIVVGGGDSAMEEATFLTRFANSVKIIHRRHELRAGPTLQRRALNHEKIAFVWDTVVERISGNGVVDHVLTHNLKTGERGELAADGVFIYIGHYPNSQFLEGHLLLDEHGYIVTDEKMRTSVPGVFAAGEIQDAIYRQIATSVGQGCAAAMQCEKWLAERE